MENDDLLILALSSGEHLLATVVESGNAYVCSNVLQILSDVDQESGQMRLGTVPYLPFADPDGGIAIPNTMASVAIPSKEMKEMYAKRFSLIYSPPVPSIIL